MAVPDRHVRGTCHALIYSKEGYNIKRYAAAGILLVTLAYFGLQVFVFVKPPFILSGYGTIKARPGQDVILSIMFRNSSAVPFKVTSVSTNTHTFMLKQSCAIKHDIGLDFTGVAQSTLPREYAERCQPLRSVNNTWTYEYAIALHGNVVSIDDEIEVTVSYRVLGWTHRVVYARRLVEE